MDTKKALEVIGLCAQNLLFVLNSIANTMGRTYTILKKIQNVHFDYISDVHVSSENNEDNGYGFYLDNHLALIVRLIF